jgi:hypothetical protein
MNGDQAIGGHGAITLRYLMAEGDRLDYDVSVDSNREAIAPGHCQREGDLLRMRLTQVVTAVNDDGSYAVEMRVRPYYLEKNGAEVPVPSGEPQRIAMKMSTSGEILETSLDEPPAQPSFPTRPISPGETWKGESRVSLQSPVTGEQLHLRLVFEYTFKGVRTELGYECAHVKVISPETRMPMGPGSEQRIAARGDTDFAHREGRLVRSVVETRIMITHPGGALQTKIKVTVELVPPGQAETEAHASGAEDEPLSPAVGEELGRAALDRPE